LQVRITMADQKDKWPDNVIGKFYVDQQCIDCDLCRETAPDFFKQPATPEEAEQCMEALESCPVEAIGSDGDGGEGVSAASSAATQK
jgi:ferredoxin